MILMGEMLVQDFTLMTELQWYFELNVLLSLRLFCLKHSELSSFSLRQRHSVTSTQIAQYQII